MSSYYVVPGVDIGVRSTANSADVRGNVRLRLAVGGEAGIVVEENAPPDIAPRLLVAIAAFAVAVLFYPSLRRPHSSPRRRPASV